MRLLPPSSGSEEMTTGPNIACSPKCASLIRYIFCLISFYSQVSYNPDNNSHIFSAFLFQWYFRNTKHIDHFTAPNSCSFSYARCGLGRACLCSHLKDVCKENKPHNHEELTQALEPDISLFFICKPALLHSDTSMNYNTKNLSTL
jgi:hypothetical protein